ncbi:MAG: serine/threonine protein phosphatase, partial [Deltaproteobacteria bacterium]
MKNRGLATQLIILILGSTAIIFVAAFAYNLVASKRAVMKEVAANARHLTLETNYRIEAVLKGVAKVPDNLAVAVENYPYKEADLLRLLKSTVANNKGIFGMAVAFEPYVFNPKKYYFCPYCYREKGQVKVSFLGGE